MLYGILCNIPYIIVDIILYNIVYVILYNIRYNILYVIKLEVTKAPMQSKRIYLLQN